MGITNTKYFANQMTVMNITNEIWGFVEYVEANRVEGEVSAQFAAYIKHEKEESAKARRGNAVKLARSLMEGDSRLGSTFPQCLRQRWSQCY
jgi:hypothetical protein